MRPRPAGLRYVSDEEPGHPAQEGRQGLRLRQARTAARSTTRRRSTRIRIARHPAGLYGCLDLPQGRTATSRRPGATPRAASSTATTRLSARSARARSTSTCSSSPQALPAIRDDGRRAHGLRGLPREKVLATVVHLLETTLIRVGNDDYAKQNKSYGLTTLRDPHVEGRRRRAALPVQGQERQDLAPAGQGPAHRQDREGLPGPARPGPVPVSRRGRRARRRHLGRRERLSARDHRRATSPPRISAPGPARCWPRWRCRNSRASTARPRRRRTSARRSSRSPSRLGNTPTICRKCYVHPEVFTCYLEGELLLEVKDEVESELRENLAGLKPEEAAVLTLLAGSACTARLRAHRPEQAARAKRKSPSRPQGAAGNARSEARA